MRRQHPANAVGFLFVEPAEYQLAMNEQLRLRDVELEQDPAFSGEPAAFTPWALDHVRQLAANDPTIGRQIADRIADLERQVERLDTTRERQLQAWQTEQQQLNHQIETLIGLTP